SSLISPKSAPNPPTPAKPQSATVKRSYGDFGEITRRECSDDFGEIIYTQTEIRSPSSLISPKSAPIPSNHA
ncbi:MAG: hypothetical protein ACK449_02455, partial [Planctomycetota bacterium]